MAILTTLLYILFCFSAFVLIVVILLQEGKGGGFGQALEGGGQVAADDQAQNDTDDDGHQRADGQPAAQVGQECLLQGAQEAFLEWPGDDHFANHLSVQYQVLGGRLFIPR